MAPHILTTLQAMSQAGQLELLETHKLDDGTTEYVFETQDDADGVSLLRPYKLPAAEASSGTNP